MNTPKLQTTVASPLACFGSQTTGAAAAETLAAHIKGKNVLIVGASLGRLGGEVARVLARHANLVVIAGRSKLGLEKLVHSIKQHVSTATLRLLLVDYESFDSVRAAADEVNAYTEPIHVLINNIAHSNNHPFACTQDGFEATWQVNYLSHFLFTNLVLPRLVAAIPQRHLQPSRGTNAPSQPTLFAPRIINISSPGHRMLQFDLAPIESRFEGGKTWGKWPAHSYSKSAVNLFTLELTKRLAEQGILAFTVNPCLIINDDELYAKGKFNQESVMHQAAKRETMANVWKTTEEGAASYVIAAFSPDLRDHAGSYIEDCQIRNDRQAAWASDPMMAKKVWKVSEKMVGQSFEH